MLKKGSNPIVLRIRKHRYLVFFTITLFLCGIGLRIIRNRKSVPRLGSERPVHIINSKASTPVFISFSQFFEDVILYQLFKDVEVGFYVDVGANFPVKLSDTKIFYENGWSGINIEPLAQQCAALKQDRLRDINLCVAAGPNRSEMTLYESGVFSTVVKDVATTHMMKRRKFTQRVVPVIPLSEILNKYCNNNTVIHFMKIDVEGFEQGVLEGMDFTRFKPQVLVLESFEPATKRQTHLDWEPLLLDNGYEFIYDLHLNRFYIHRDHPELKNNFKPLEQLQNIYKLVRY